MFDENVNIVDVRSGDESRTAVGRRRAQQASPYSRE